MNNQELIEKAKAELARISFEGEHSVDTEIECFCNELSRGFRHDKYYADSPSAGYEGNGKDFLTKPTVVKLAQEQLSEEVRSNFHVRVNDQGQGQSFILILSLIE